ncbi:MAG: hypothetical protein R3F11_07930 [Verrucomicrobiales bacterium]
MSLSRRQTIVARYQSAFADLPFLQILFYGFPLEDLSLHLYTPLFDFGALASRTAVMLAGSATEASGRRLLHPGLSPALLPGAVRLPTREVSGSRELLCAVP